jgi:hypothetical protein
MRKQLIQTGQELKDKLAVLEEKLTSVENALQVGGQRIPNLTQILTLNTKTKP